MHVALSYLPRLVLHKPLFWLLGKVWSFYWPLPISIKCLCKVLDLKHCELEPESLTFVLFRQVRPHGILPDR